MNIKLDFIFIFLVCRWFIKMDGTGGSADLYDLNRAAYDQGYTQQEVDG